ncbi:hypothetical protein ACH5RR_028700 [Cinchona calisaya]|uniref:Uncharacterized protein n=1 Tax=Cinchona calisaya TaxID=153742 RepID=A0ABD2YRC6_9GENT
MYILCEDDAKNLAVYRLSFKLIDVFFIHKKAFLLTGSGSMSSMQRTCLDTGIEKGKNNAPHNLLQTAMAAPTIDVDMVNSGSQNRQARRKHLVRKKVKRPLKKACRGSKQRGLGRKHVPRKQSKSPFEKACRGNKKRGKHVGVGNGNFAAENHETKEAKNGETVAIENVDTDADYFDANNVVKIAKIIENTGAKNDENAFAENHATQQAENPDNGSSTVKLNTHPSQDTSAKPNAGTPTQEHVGEPTNLPNSDYEFEDEIEVFKVAIAEEGRLAWANVKSHFKTQEQTIEVDNMVNSNQTHGKGEAEILMNWTVMKAHVKMMVTSLYKEEKIQAKMMGTADIQIKSMMIEHSCARTIYHRLARSSFSCEKYREDIRIIPHWKVSDFQTKVHNDLNDNITRNQAYLTKRKAKE